MNVTIIRTNTGNFGKIGSYNVQEVGLAEALKNLGHNVSVLYLDTKLNRITKSKEYDYVYYLPCKTFLMHGLFNVNLLEQFAPNVIIHFSDNQIMAKNMIGWSKKRGIKYICYFGAVLSDNPHFLNQAYTKLILMRNFKSYKYSINIAKTKKAADEMEKHKIKPAKVINVGLDETLLHSINDKKQNNENDEISLLFVGRLVEYKKPVLALMVLLELLNQGYKAKLTLIGKGKEQENIDKYIKENNLEKYVTVKNGVPYNEMYKFYEGSDFFMNFSDKEIFGMAMLESMYYGNVVIAHDAPGPREFLIDNENGFYCNSFNPKDWAEKIICAKENKEMIIENAHKTINEKFLWKSTAKQFTDFFKS